MTVIQISLLFANDWCLEMTVNCLEMTFV